MAETHNPIAMSLNQASLLLEGTGNDEIVHMLEIAASNINSLQENCQTLVAENQRLRANRRLRQRIAELEKATDIAAQINNEHLAREDGYNAEIARLKNELDVAMKLAGHTAPALDAKIRECVLLNAEVSSLQEINHDLQESCIQKDGYAQALRDRNDLLKAALRWMVGSDTVYDSDIQRQLQEKFLQKFIADAPPQFAAVIAEAVESGKVGG